MLGRALVFLAVVMLIITFMLEQPVTYAIGP